MLTKNYKAPFAPRGSSQTAPARAHLGPTKILITYRRETSENHCDFRLILISYIKGLKFCLIFIGNKPFIEISINISLANNDLQGEVVITPETVGTITPEPTGTITPLTPKHFVR